MDDSILPVDQPRISPHFRIESGSFFQLGFVMSMWKTLLQWYSPAIFYRRTGRLLPWLRIITIVLFSLGLWTGLAVAPADYQQGDAFRIIYLHVPSAFLSLGLYAFCTSMAVVTLVWRIKIAELLLTTALPIGASMTALALITGSLWGKPMWGTWWIWDARLTSELVLLFVYLGLIGLHQALPSSTSKTRILAIMVLVGSVDLPIIHYSVEWWNTLHQGSSLSLFAKPTIVGSMLYPLLIQLAAFSAFAAWQIIQRTRSTLLVQDKRSQWVQQIVTEVQS